jgi:hypothetical protein
MTHRQLVIRKEMGYSLAEFARVLPLAMRDWTMSGGPLRWQVLNGDAVKLADIVVEVLPERRIAALSLPVLAVSIEIGDIGPTVADEFVRRFDRGFHRGGG